MCTIYPRLTVANTLWCTKNLSYCSAKHPGQSASNSLCSRLYNSIARTSRAIYTYVTTLHVSRLIRSCFSYYINKHVDTITPTLIFIFTFWLIRSLGLLSLIKRRTLSHWVDFNPLWSHSWIVLYNQCVRDVDKTHCKVHGFIFTIRLR